MEIRLIEPPPLPAPAYRLDPAALTVAVGFAMIDPPRHAEGTTPLARIQSALWREDPAVVAGLYDRLELRDWHAGSDERERHVPLPSPAERLALVEKLTAGWTHPLAGHLWAPKSKSRKRRQGVTVSELAEQIGVPREALARALEHHGYLEMAPYRGCHKRRLVTQAAESAMFGHNVDPSASRSVKLDGAASAAPFPIFYVERLPEIVDRIGFDGIRTSTAEMPDRRDRLAWLLAHHGYLPNDFIAELSGYSEPGVRKARGASPAKSTTQVIEVEPTGRRTEGSSYIAIGPQEHRDSSQP